jgi:hypothetical protein
VWPQYWDLQGPRRLEQSDLRNLNLGDLKKGPNGGVSPTPHKKKSSRKVAETVGGTTKKTVLFNTLLCKREKSFLKLVFCMFSILDIMM